MIWVKSFQSLRYMTKGITLLIDLKCKSNKNPQKFFIHLILNLFFLLIVLKESKTDFDGSSLRPF